jgi:ankyrin repeat protein
MQRHPIKQRAIVALALAAAAICGVQAQTAGPATGTATSNTSLDGAAIRQRVQDYYFDAARRGDVAMLKEFIDARYDLETRDAKGYTALILSTYHGHANAVRLLIDAGANPCAADQRGNTALMGAVFKGELAISRMLMKAACDPNHRNNAGQTPAMYAALFGRVEVLKGLVAQGADLRMTDNAGNSAESLLPERPKGQGVQTPGRAP